MKNSNSGISILGNPGAVSWGGGEHNSGEESQERDFSSPEFFLTRLDFSLPPLTTPGSPWMGGSKSLQD